MNILDEILKERQEKMESGTFCCDECGKECAVEEMTERWAFSLICAVCAERLEYDDNEGTLEA